MEAYKKRNLRMDVNMKILIIHTCGLGDMIVFTPAFEVLSKMYPSAEFDVITVQKFAEYPVMFRRNVKNIFTVPVKPVAILKLATKLRKRKYDISIVTTVGTPWKGAFFSFLIGAKTKIGEIRSNFTGFFYTKSVLYEKKIHRAERALRLARTIVPQNIHAPNYPTFPLKEEHYIEASKLLVNRDLSRFICIGIHPGTAINFLSRRWGKRNYSILINKISAKFPNVRSVIFGTQSEREEIDYILQNSNAVYLGETPLEITAALISKMKIFISNDSGLGHIASCFENIWNISLFGPTDEAVARPYGDKSIVVRSDVCRYAPCSDAYDKSVKNCGIVCMNELSVDKVFVQINNLLAPFTDRE